MTVSDVAKRFELHPETIGRYMHQGELPALEFERVWRMERKEVDKFTEAVRQKTKK